MHVTAAVEVGIAVVLISVVMGMVVPLLLVMIVSVGGRTRVGTVL